MVTICAVKNSADMETFQPGFNAEEIHTKKRSFEVSHTEDTIRGKPKAKAAPKANVSGPGTADPNQLDPEQGSTPSEWEKFMIISEEKLITLEAEIGELGEWIAPVFKDDLALLGGRLRDVEGLWFDPNTGECNRNDQNLIASMSSFKKVFNRRVAPKWRT